MALADYYLPLKHNLPFSFHCAAALLSTSVCECKYVTQLLCTQTNSKLCVPIASVFILFGNGSSHGAGRSSGVGLANQPAVSVVIILISGDRGRVFVYINTLLRFIFCISGLKVEIMIEYLP